MREMIMKCGIFMVFLWYFCGIFVVFLWYFCRIFVFISI